MNVQLDASAERRNRWLFIVRALWLLAAALAKHLGVDARVEAKKEIIDPKVQWGKWTNIFKNAAFWTVVYLLLAPFRWLKNLFKRESPKR